MEKCEFCGMKMPKECDGIRYDGPDPFAEDIYGDSSDYFMCDGERYLSAQDI
jgi:hypothetical protein